MSSYNVKPTGLAFHNGLLAVSAEDVVEQNNGQVFFFDSNGNFIQKNGVGVAPVMLTFTPNGRYLLINVVNLKHWLIINVIFSRT